MKTLPTFAALAALTLASCQKPAVEIAVEPEPAPVATPAPPPPPVAVVATPAPATPPPRELAPEGIFYLRAKHSVTTDVGITGYPPGTILRVAGDGYLAPDGALLKIAAHEVTNDMQEARQLAAYVASAQAAKAQRIAAGYAAEEAARQAQATPPARRPAPAPVQYVPEPSTSQPPTGLGATHSRTEAFGPRGKGGGRVFNIR